MQFTLILFVLLALKLKQLLHHIFGNGIYQTNIHKNTIIFETMKYISVSFTHHLVSEFL